MRLFWFAKRKKKKYKKGTNHLKTLIKYAYLNGQITQPQRNYLISTGRKFNFSSKDISRLIKETKANKKYPKSNFNQDHQFKSLLNFTSVSPQPTSEQKSFFLDVSEDIGIERKQALDALEEAQDNGHSSNLKIA